MHESQIIVIHEILLGSLDPHKSGNLLRKDHVSPEGYTTRFVFPYCAGKDFSGYKSVSDLKSALNSRLSSLGCDTLLFMHHLKTIKYRML